MDYVLDCVKETFEQLAPPLSHDLFGEERPLVVIEDVPFGLNRAYAKENAGMAWLFRHWLWLHGHDYLLVAPSQIKKFCVGDGRAEKNCMIKYLEKRFGVDTDDDNVADAVTLAHIGAAFIGRYECSIQPQREVIAELRKRLPLTFSRQRALARAADDPY